jgi:type II secretory pathway component PulC
MSEKQTVYVVTQGEYSDYRIKAIFSQPPDEKWLERNPDLDVEEWVLDEVAKYFDYSIFQIAFELDGGIRWVGYTPVTSEGDMAEQPRVAEVKYPKPGLMVSGILARDEEHAKKIAIDKRAEFVAHKAGLA